jgi:EcsC protein family
MYLRVRMPDEVRLEPPGRVPESLWRRIRAEPDRAPEHIALGAAERFAPQAERWVAIAGPGHAADRLARIAVKKHVRLARLEGAALGLGGGFTAAPDLVALLWIQSRMVFFVAAAYGYDPRHPMRPAELLALQDVYPTAAAAREAIDGVGKRMAQALVERGLRGGRNRALTARLVRYAGERIARRYARRLVPFVGAPIGAIQNAGATADIGRKALAYYGGAQARP